MFDDDEIPDGRKLPIFKKGQEIDELTRRILDLIPEDNEELKEIAEWMAEDSGNLARKVLVAEAAGLYDLKMENAAIIRASARELIVNLHTLEMYGFKETQYFDLLRQAVEGYRLLFIGWVATFDRWNYEVDRWGLFNPPGVGPDDGG